MLFVDIQFLYFSDQLNFSGSRASFYRKGNWASSKCSDPATLYEFLVIKPQDLLESISFGFYSKPTSAAVTIEPKFSTKVLSPFDRPTYGRCYVATLTKEMTSFGIKWVRIYAKKNVEVFLHSHGMLETEGDLNKIKVNIGEFKDIDVEHEVYELLSHGEQSCNLLAEYNKDVCEHEMFERNTIKVNGCTTPFGPNKDKICKNPAKSTTVLEEFWKIFGQSGWNKQCIFPCTHIKIKQSVHRGGPKDISTAFLLLRFQENIKVMRYYHLKSIYSLFAKIGGCLGIFLTLFQIYNVIKSQYLCRTKAIGSSILLQSGHKCIEIGSVQGD